MSKIKIWEFYTKSEKSNKIAVNIIFVFDIFLNYSFIAQFRKRNIFKT